MRNQLEHIYFLCCSNKVDTLALAEPLVDSILKLEEGIILYDSKYNENVMVIAPVLMILGDNPMTSELCNHQGSTAKKFCRICLVSSIIFFLLLL